MKYGQARLGWFRIQEDEPKTQKNERKSCMIDAPD
jgi:hypothetical protein